MSSDEDELKVLYQRIENEKIIVNIDVDEINQRLEGLDEYVQQMTYFCGFVVILLFIIFYTLFSKGLFF